MNKKIFINFLDKLGLEFDERKISYETAKETFLTDKKVIFLLDDGAVVADDLISFEKNIILSKGEFYSFDGIPIKKYCINNLGFDSQDEQLTPSEMDTVNRMLNIGNISDSEMQKIIEKIDEEAHKRGFAKHLFEVEDE